ncbi:MAG: rhomboid family intramembrane serine protease [Tannerellaceae bacterium]|jgi:membrane associated rhomboid family serine protease|nr:rhomboid family intramembrane serine protease [Tannerellaceae bacterium]
MSIISNAAQRLTPVVRHLIILNGLTFFAALVAHRYGFDLFRLCALHFPSASGFRLWQPFTYLFLHDGFAHLFCNLLPLFVFAPLFEARWGARRFTIFYFAAGLGAALCQWLTWIPSLSVLPPGHPFLNHFISVGASGAVFAILFAFGFTFPNAPLLIFPLPWPIKAKFFVAAYALFELVAGVAQVQGDSIAHFAHLGGMLIAFLLLKLPRSPFK